MPKMSNNEAKRNIVLIVQRLSEVYQFCQIMDSTMEVFMREIKKINPNADFTPEAPVKPEGGKDEGL